VDSFTPRPLYPQGKSPWYPLDRRLGGHQRRSGRGGEEKNYQPPSGIEPWNPDSPARGPALYRLSYHGSYDVPALKHHSMKTYGGVDIKLRTFLTSALDRASRSGHFTPVPIGQEVAWVPEAIARRRNLRPCRDSNPGYPDGSLVTILSYLCCRKKMFCT
jgi:hypothetical protein